jgi:hypothetical protein
MHVGLPVRRSGNRSPHNRRACATPLTSAWHRAYQQQVWSTCATERMGVLRGSVVERPAMAVEGPCFRPLGFQVKLTAMLMCQQSDVLSYEQ